MRGPTVVDDVAENIRNEQSHHGVDHNPTLECDECGDTYPWKHFKKHGKVSSDPAVPLLCALCNGGIRLKSVEERKAENRALDDFACGDDL